MDIIVRQSNGVIEENFTEAKAYLQEQLNAYKGVVFTEDTKTDAKNTVANLRKDKKALQDKVKAVKVEYMKPFDEFNAKANELLTLYDEPIDYINGQVAEFEERRKQEKKEQIEAIYAELVPEEEWQNVIPLRKIYNSKWENATTTVKSIKEEIMSRKQDVKTAYTAIKALHSDFEDKAIDMYNANYDLNATMAYIEKWEAERKEWEQNQKEKLEVEQKRQQAELEERIRQEERAKIAMEQQAQEEKKQAVTEAIEQTKQQTIDGFVPTSDEKPTDYTYMIRLNSEAKEKLEMFMDSVGIDYLCL